MKEFNGYIETNQWLKKIMDELNEEDGMRLEDAFYAFKYHYTNVNPRFKINGLCRRKEGWRYAGSIERAKDIQKKAIDFGINSLIYEWVDGRWVNVG